MSLNYDGLSMNDRRFSYLVEKKRVKVNGHNKLPLPLKEEDIQLPINSTHNEMVRVL